MINGEIMEPILGRLFIWKCLNTQSLMAANSFIDCSERILMKASVRFFYSALLGLSDVIETKEGVTWCRASYVGQTDLDLQPRRRKKNPSTATAGTLGIGLTR